MGTRKIFILGIFLNGIGPALFGLLHFANSPVVFMSVAVILRGVEGIGYCFIQIPGLMTINHAFPGKMSIAAVSSANYVVSESCGKLANFFLFSILLVNLNLISFTRLVFLLE